MAMLSRPGVDITQVLTPAAPTVVTPGLVPCVVGPCFQIVRPLADGRVNGAAKILTAAVLVADSSTAGTVDLSGATLNIVVSGLNKTVQFPAVVVGAQYSKAQILSVINAQLVGLVVATYNSNNQLVLKTLAKGPANAGLAVTYAPGGTVEKLGFTASKTVTGAEAYTGLTYSTYFSDLPSTKTAVSELVFDSSNLDVYRDFSNTLSQVSKTSAVQWTSLVPEIDPGSTDLSVTTSSWRRSSLFAKNKPGPRTNVVTHNGAQARIRIPLSHTVGNGATKWPDVTGLNYLDVVCTGPEAQGLYIGDDGNAVTVKFVLTAVGGDPTCAAAWSALNKQLTITFKSTCTFADLRAAIQTASGFNTPISGYAATAFRATMVSDATLDAQLALSGLPLPNDGSTTNTFTLSGGQDPVNFAIDSTGTNEKAVVRGSVATGTADALGVTDETIFISVDGAPYVPVVLTPGGTAVHTTINSAGAGVIATSQSVTLADGSSVSVLELVADGANTGADSTISIRADNPLVIQKLLSGFNQRTESIAANTMLTSAAWNNQVGAVDARQVKLLPGSGGNYNTRASTAGEKAIVPNSMTLTLTDLVSAGLFLFPANALLGQGALAGDAKDLSVIHSVGGTFDLDIMAANGSLTAASTREDLVEAINTAIATASASAYVTCGLAGDYVVISEATGVAGATLELMDVGTGTSTTTANIKTWLNGSAGQWDVDSTTVSTAEITLRDNNGAWELVSANTDLSADWKVATAITLTNTILGSLLLDSGSGFSYSTGQTDLANAVAGSLVFKGQAQNIAGNIAVNALKPLSVRLYSGTFGQITYTRLQANAIHGAPADYQNKVFQGRPNRVKVGDVVYNNGVVKGRVVGFESSVYAGVTYSNNALVLSDFSVDNNSSLQGWYVVAEGLDQETVPRLQPELVVSELDQQLTLKHTLNRDLAGIPTLSGSSFLYVGYKALRKDVSADTANPGILTFQDLSEVDTLIGPIDPENPLAFAMYVAFLHRVDVTVSAMGVSSVSADSPEGTVQAYAEALDFLALKEVYVLAPLTQDPAVHGLFSQHCTALSEPEGRKERIALVNRALPTEKVATLTASGTATIGAGYGPTNTLFDLTFTDPSINLLTALNGKTTAGGTTIDLLSSGGTLTPADGVYIDRSGDPYRYLVVGVPDASTLTIQVDNVYGPGAGPGTGGNGDAFFRTSVPASFEADGETCAVYIRQAALSLSTTAGKLAVCEALAEIAGGPAGYQNRRLFLVQPEKVGLDFNGTELLIPGYYLCVADAARIAQLKPSQPFTNLPYNGFTRVVGSSDKFSENQMATAAAGGIWWVVQDTPGGSLVCRHQLSTDVSTLKSRELSVTKAIDFLAKLIREQVRRFTGRNNITAPLLETIGLSCSAVLSSAVSVVQQASLDKLEQDPSNPDTVIVEISADPYYPCNRIKITIKV